MKKLLSVILCIAMVLSLGVCAFAAGKTVVIYIDEQYAVPEEIDKTYQDDDVLLAATTEITTLLNEDQETFYDSYEKMKDGQEGAAQYFFFQDSAVYPYDATYKIEGDKDLVFKIFENNEWIEIPAVADGNGNYTIVLEHKSPVLVIVNDYSEGTATGGGDEPQPKPSVKAPLASTVTSSSVPVAADAAAIAGKVQMTSVGDIRSLDEEAQTNVKDAYRGIIGAVAEGYGARYFFYQAADEYPYNAAYVIDALEDGEEVKILYYDGNEWIDLPVTVDEENNIYMVEIPAEGSILIEVKQASDK